MFYLDCGFLFNTKQNLCSVKNHIHLYENVVNYEKKNISRPSIRHSTTITFIIRSEPMGLPPIELRSKNRKIGSLINRRYRVGRIHLVGGQLYTLSNYCLRSGS